LGRFCCIGYLQKLGVTVFQQASRGENRIVTLIDEMEVVRRWCCVSVIS